jgi:hypothetical protein
MLFKTTKRLFRGKYQYKLVLTCAGASWFRGGDWNGTLENLKRIDLSNNANWYAKSIKTSEDLDYAFKLQSRLKKLTDIEVRVESPWVTIYTNTKSNIDDLVKIDKDKVKYISVPPNKTLLDENTIILPKVNYDYKVTLGKTTQEHSAFIQWAENNAKLKLTKTCKRELTRDGSWGGTYFYVTGENNLLMTKMHLGGSINKVERIIKA